MQIPVALSRCDLDEDRQQMMKDTGDFGDCVGVVMRGGKQFYERRFGGSGHSEGRGFRPLLEGQETSLDIDICRYDIYGDMIVGSPISIHGGVSARADSVRVRFDTTAIAVIVRP